MLQHFPGNSSNSPNTYYSKVIVIGIVKLKTLQR